jgi:hypothetical protein
VTSSRYFILRAPNKTRERSSWVSGETLAGPKACAKTVEPKSRSIETSARQKMIAFRWMSYPLRALAWLQLGRAYSMSGDKAKAQSAYRDFLTLWKDADPDIPILKEARAEYAKLQ